MEDTDRAVATRPQTELAHTGPLDEDFGLLSPEMVVRIKEQVKLHRDMKIAVLGCTATADWQDFNGHPYPEDDAIHAIAVAVGLRFGKPSVAREERKDAKGIIVEFVCELSATWRGREYHEIGTSSTRDKFFSRANKQDVPFEEIDQGDVRKKSVTNAQHRLLVKALGIGGVTWEDLSQVGIRPGGAGGARFKGTERKMTTGSGGWTQDKRKLWGLILDLCDGDEALAGRELQRKTANAANNFPGVADPQKLSDKQVGWLLPMVEKAHHEHFSGPPDDEAPPREPGEEG